MRTPWLVVIGVLLFLWPNIRQAWFPWLRTGIAWEKLIWGYRPGILPRFIGMVCVLLGLIIGQPESDSSAASQHPLFWTMFVVAAIVITWATVVTRQKTDSQEEEYFKKWRGSKIILYIGILLLCYVLINWGMRWYLGKHGVTDPQDLFKIP